MKRRGSESPETAPASQRIPVEAGVEMKRGEERLLRRESLVRWWRGRRDGEVTGRMKGVRPRCLFQEEENQDIYI